MIRNNIIIIGAGGHSRVVISLLRQTDEWAIKGIIDIGYNEQTELIMGVPVIGGEEKLSDSVNNCSNAFIALGNNEQRQLWYDKVKALGFNIPNVISNDAYVDPSAHLGKGNLICTFGFVGPECVVGNNNILNTHSNFEHESVIEDHAHLAPSTTIGGRCCIGTKVFVGSGSIILPKVELPNDTIIGANSLVRNSLKMSGTYVGSPVRLLK